MTSGVRVVVFAAALSAMAVGCGSPPTDQQLRAEFRARRADYDTLLAMFHADSGVGRVADGWTRPANFFSGAPQSAAAGLAEERFAQYRRFFDRLSLKGGIEGYDRKHIINFWRYGSGMGAGLGGTGKGLAFSDSLPPDKPAAFGCTSPQDDCWRYRPIEAGWFVFEERHN
jgi:hypothetical protein